jgi:NitT/TauT family transport system permease protein
MTAPRIWQGYIALIALAVAILLPLSADGPAQIYLLDLGTIAVLVAMLLAGATLVALRPDLSGAGIFILFLGAHAGGALALWILPEVAANSAQGFVGRLAALPGFWGLVVLDWLLAWTLVTRLSFLRPPMPAGAGLMKIFIPLLFGLWLLFLWEVFVRGFAVSPVLLPAPSAVWDRIVNASPILWADFRQTFLKAVLAGYVIGSLSGFLVALAADRVPFLRRGLLPIGNLVSALPIVGVAPIMVIWFGFDWPSKAAVVAVMTFFPMLVNTVAGLSAADRLERDLMRTYAADHRQTLTKLRLPAAMPFIFNALKINTTLAMIGAIVAEFFGTPTVGMGFRISTEVGRLSIDMVWAEIAVAAVAGSAFYGIMALAERVITFWHPSFRT